MKKAIVTGANGFLGSLLVKYLLDHHVEVIAADLIKDNNRIPEQAKFVQFNMEKFETLKDIVTDRDIDVIYHMAWVGSFGNMRGNYEVQLNNVKYTCDAVKIASDMNIKRFVGAGTLAQMDCLGYIGENGSSPNVVSCYGTAKIAAQYMSKAIANVERIEHIWCFISNTYGVGDTTMNFINFAAKQMLNGERPSFTDGEHNYDFVYITDTIKGLYLCGENGENNNSYYIGSGNAKKLKEFIKVIRDTIDKEIVLYFGEIPFKGRSLPLNAYDCTKIYHDTGYIAEIDFETGIQKTVEWLKGLEIEKFSF